MNRLQPILLLLKYSYKLQTRSTVVFLLSFITPLGYTTILLAQILINYSIVNNPFISLPLEEYIITFFILQMIVFLSFDQSQRFVAKEILNGSFDYMLLRPLNLFYFKYFRVPSLLSMIMVLFYVIALIIATLVYKIPFVLVLKMILFAIIASFIILNLRTALRGLVFFKRDILNSTRVEEAMNIFVINKPPEVFPIFLQVVLTFVLPFMVVHNNAFNIIRQTSEITIWSLLVSWSIIAVLLNKTVWSYGLKRYESG